MSRRWQEDGDKKRKQRQKATPAFRGFVTHSLTAEMRKDYAQYELTEDFAEDLLLRVVNDGYRLSLSVDKRNGAYMAAMSTKDDGNRNFGLVLTARSGSSPYQAGMRATFLHYQVFAEDWPDPQETEEYEDEWSTPPE